MPRTQFHFEGRFLGIAERDHWEFATRTNARAVVVIVPLTAENELVLVEQFRIPVGARVIELPAGLVGDGAHLDESLDVAAQRELEEETGYRAGQLTPILQCPSSAGLTDEMITIFLGLALEKVGTGGGDASEDIEIHHVPLDKAPGWLARRQQSGAQLDPKIYAALYWLDRLARGEPPIPPATA